MARKKMANFRLPEEITRMLDELEEATKLSRTDLVIQAIRGLYRKETGRKKPEEKPGEDA